MSPVGTPRWQDNCAVRAITAGARRYSDASHVRQSAIYMHRSALHRAIVAQARIPPSGAVGVLMLGVSEAKVTSFR